MRLRRAPRNPTGEMTLLEHLLELRSRLIKSAVALVACAAVATIWLYEPALELLKRPYCQIPESYRAIKGECDLLAQGPLSGFDLRMRVGLALGLVMAMPVIAFQAWRFIAPGLKPNEKRYAVPFAITSTLLFAGGLAVAFFTLPRAMTFLVSLGGEGLAYFLQADQYLKFVLFMALAFGATFEFPLVLVALSLVGLLSSDAMLRAWRVAVVVLIVVAAVVTPSQDPLSLFAMTVPLWVFYFAAIAVARFLIEPARTRRRAQALKELQ